MEYGSLMKIESIAECSTWILQNATLGAFCNTFDLNLSDIRYWKPLLVFFLSGRCRRQVLL